MASARTLRCKLSIFGNSTVGKSSIVSMLKSDGQQYPKNYVMTVGAEFHTKKIVVTEGTAIELFLFDYSGKDMYKDLIANYFDGTTMIALVYDITNQESFSACQKWLDIAKQLYPETASPLTGTEISVLIANKTDKDDRIAVRANEAREFAQSNGLEYFECSASKGVNIEAPFVWIANTYLSYYEEKLKVYDQLKAK